MLANNTYPKSSTENKALSSAFTCSGLLICLMSTLAILDVAASNNFRSSNVLKAPEIKAAFVQPKPMGSIFVNENDTKIQFVDQALGSSLGKVCISQPCDLHKR